MKTSTSSLSRALQIAAAIVVVALVAWFFRGQFVRNWDQLRARSLSPQYPLLLLSFLSILLSYLVVTSMWRRGVNRLAAGRAFSFAESVGMVNTTQLTKYIPGKVWGYAMQMALVDRRSLPISAVLYVNLVVVLTNSFIAVIVGGVYLTAFSTLVPRVVAGLATAAVAAVYVAFLLWNGRFFSLLGGAFARLFRRTFVFQDLGPATLAAIQLEGLAAAFLFGLSAVLASAGLGFPLTLKVAWSTFAGFLFSDTVGFLAFFVPGGLGVREGLLYLLLGELGAGSLALILPLVLRLISMLVDAVLGLLGAYTLRRYVRSGAQ